MRIIDGAKLVEKLRLIATCWSISPFVSKEKHNGAVDMLREVEKEVKEAPTLTPPNEPEYREYTCPNCHHTWLEDRDASDYPEYCPGCGDPLHKEENEPLTLEQLRESPHGKIKDSTLQSICNRANEIACRPPEGEEEA